MSSIFNNDPEKVSFDAESQMLRFSTSTSPDSSFPSEDQQSMCLVNNDLSNNTETNCSTLTSTRASFYAKCVKLNLKDSTAKLVEQSYLPLSYQPVSVVCPNKIALYHKHVLLFNFLERPTSTTAKRYHALVCFASIVCMVLYTVLSCKDTDPLCSHYSLVINILDYCTLLFITSDFAARLWASQCVSMYHGWKGKLRFVKDLVRFASLIVIIASWITVLVAFVTTNNHIILAIELLRYMRCLQIMQTVVHDFLLNPWKIMASAVRSHRQQLAIVCNLAFLIFFTISLVMYYVERGENEMFDSLASSMWWSIVSLCTIGYGDIYPVTPVGKVIASLVSVIGIIIFATPAGIIGTGLALKVNEHKRQLKISKRKQPAAKLIQCAWRLYKCEQELIDLEESAQFRSAIWKRFYPNKKSFEPLSNTEKSSVLFVCTVKLSIAKRDFLKAFQPYDIKDVLDRFQAGHADMLEMVRALGQQQQQQSGSISPRISRSNQLESQMAQVQQTLDQIVQQLDQLRQTPMVQTSEQTIAMLCAKANLPDIHQFSKMAFSGKYIAPLSEIKHQIENTSAKPLTRRRSI